MDKIKVSEGAHVNLALGESAAEGLEKAALMDLLSDQNSLSFGSISEVKGDFKDLEASSWAHFVLVHVEIGVLVADDELICLGKGLEVDIGLKLELVFNFGEVFVSLLKALDSKMEADKDNEACLFAVVFIILLEVSLEGR
jgi:hypothetical protein